MKGVTESMGEGGLLVVTLITIIPLYYIMIFTQLKRGQMVTYLSDHLHQVQMYFHCHVCFAFQGFQ